MSDRSAQSFLESLKTSGIVSPQRAETLSGEFVDTSLTGAGIAESLIDRKLLTDYQSEKLLAGDASSLLIAERYEIRALLGSGGMGEVFLARDRQLDRDVAIKVLPARLVPDPDAVARFEREAKAMAKLSHPNIVQAHDAGTDGQKQFLVMEFVNGENLSQRLKQHGPIDPPTAADFAYQTALALDHAHCRGLVHRDLKPSNLLVTQDGTVKVLDLGLAKFAQDQIDDESITMAGAGLGTPDYMAPEQFADAKNADERSDVYALGCTLYHMLTGRVPFPGSSLSEKQRAHQQAEPEPIARSGVPAGLAQAVYRMMAKKPADRFQSARECAEALTPYVDVSSASLPNLNATVDWDGSVMTIVTTERRRRRLAKWGMIGALLVLFSSGLGFGVAQFFGGGEPEDSNRGGDRRIANKTLPGKTLGKANEGGQSGKKKSSKKPPKPKPDPWVLTVAQDGSGQFKTINAALEKAKPGMTVHIRDDSEYKEQLLIGNRHSGVTILADRGATLVNDTAQAITIRVTDAHDLTVRGLRIEMKSQRQSGVGIKGDCYGTLFQDVEFVASRGQRCNGVEFLATNADASRPPTDFRDCRFRGLQAAVAPYNRPSAGKSPQPVRGLRVLRCDFYNCLFGVTVKGAFERLHVVGNRFVRSRNAAVQFQDVLPGVKNVLVANNSFFDNTFGLRLWDGKLTPADIQVRNNLVLSPSVSDFIFIDSGGSPTKIKGAGDTAALRRSWKLGENFREIKRPTGSGLDAKAWIPEAKTSVVRDSIKVLSRDPTGDDFLRPEAEADLATQGAGNTDPALPTYVGAVPPKGTRAWDWDRTWRMPPGEHHVLTVSKNAKAGGKYRTINAALKDAQPWDTIRVLDDAIYKEAIVLDGKAHLGVVLEASGKAVIQAPPGEHAIRIANVADCAVRGFDVRGATGRGVFVVRISGRVSGTRLEGLTLQDLGRGRRGTVLGIENISIDEHPRPLVIRRCTIHSGGQGIAVTGAPAPAGPCNGVCLCENRISGTVEAIEVGGYLRGVQVVANLIDDSDFVGIDLQDLSSATRGLVLANNTVFKSVHLIRLSDNPPYETVESAQAEVAGNVLFDATGADLIHMQWTSLTDGKPVAGRDLLRAWRFRDNWRDLSGTNSAQAIPFVKGKFHHLADPEFLSRKPGDPDYMRPNEKSPLATGGAGGDLPSYAGAVPPKGAKPWDWNVTWRSRRMRAKYAAKTESKSTPE